MSWLSQTAEIVRLEGAFYARNPRLVVAALAVSLIPAIYVLIFLASVWDPLAHSDSLPVALVNRDRDAHYREAIFNVGREVVAALKEKKTFRYVETADAEAARAMVRKGRAAFALVIPDDFSSNALPGTRPGAGKLEVIASEGNSYQGALLARRFAAELEQDINDRLNERRWQLVLTNVAGSEQSVDRLRTAVADLRNGGSELSTGAAQVARGTQEFRKRLGELDDGVEKMATGGRELGKALRALDAKQPAPEELQRLKTGADELARGHVALGKGLVELKSGSVRIRDGLVKFRDEAQSSFFASQEVQDGAAQLAEGMTQLDQGLQAAVDAERRLGDGANKLADGVGSAIEGAKAQSAALRQITRQLPADAQLDALQSGSAAARRGGEALADGSQKLQDGAARLALGLNLLADALPRNLPGFEGSAAGLSHSVQPQVSIEAPVPNNGSGYAPNIIPAALWLGAGIAAFLVHVRVLPLQARRRNRLVQVAGKIAIPSLVVLLQGLFVLLAVVAFLNVQMVNPLAVAAAVATTALTFLAIVFALTRALGDAGKALSILLLAVQLSSSGGVLPIELSGGVFAEISPWLPLTWVVKSLKAGMFGAFDGVWDLALVPVAIAGLLALVFAAFVGSWRYVEQGSMRPPVEF